MKAKLCLVSMAFTGAMAFGGSAWAGEESAFNKLDVNGDGMISAQEAAADPVLHDAWSTADANQDGQLEYGEFSAFEMKAVEDAK